MCSACTTRSGWGGWTLALSAPRIRNKEKETACEKYTLLRFNFDLPTQYMHIVRFYGTTHIGTAFGLLHYTHFHYFTIWCRSGPHKNRPVLGSRTYICILGRSRVRERGEGRGGGSR